MGAISVYIHIPFCLKKCAYCDFASFAGREGDWDRYLSALEGELTGARRKYGRLQVSTLFFGGGTPSVVPSGFIVHLTAMCRALFSVEADAEITVEANPGTLTREKLRDYRDAGINRLSIGAQAAQDDLLMLLGRVHGWAQVEEAVELAREAGFDNLNIDLMYALPGQTMAEWVDTVKRALRLQPSHLSMYSLILEEGTPLTGRVARGELVEPDEELTLKMQHAAARIASGRGYARYEISNYALPGRECRHNIAYWTRQDYLGLGLAAHSLMNGERFANTADLSRYLAGEREASREAIGEEGAREEAIMLMTRMARGVDESLVRVPADGLKRLAALDLIKRRNGRIMLTDKGMDLQDAVVLELIGGAPSSKSGAEGGDGVGPS